MINCRTHRAQVGGVDFTDEPIVEVDAPAILPPRLETDGLPDESFTDETTAPLPVDLAIGPHLPDGPATRVAWRTRPTITPPAPVIDLRGRDQAKGLMRALFVVILQPVLKPPLLGLRRGRGWTGVVRFEFPMPLLMRRIVSGARPAAESGPDAQTHPPRAQLGEPGRTGAGSRPPLIGMNPAGQAKTTKKPHKFALNRRQFVTVQNANT